MTDKIELTPQELEEIKDVVKFREKVTLGLKTLATDFKEHCQASQGFRDDVVSLKVHRVVHWILLSCLILGILSKAIRMW